jgi:hypothetical protein
MLQHILNYIFWKKVPNLGKSFQNAVIIISTKNICAKAAWL